MGDRHTTPRVLHSVLAIHPVANAQRSSVGSDWALIAVDNDGCVPESARSRPGLRICAAFWMFRSHGCLHLCHYHQPEGYIRLPRLAVINPDPHRTVTEAHC